MLFIRFILFIIILSSHFFAYGLSLTTPLKESDNRLRAAIHNPEYMLDHWIDLPISPEVKGNKKHYLSLREAILLSLRYNPNIQNAELDRIVQRYQLRLAHNEFELQYALGGTAAIERTHYTGAGNATTKSYIATPEINLKTKTGTEVKLNMDNTIQSYGNYNPLLNLSLTQPLLRGFGRSVTEANLRDAIDNEWLNKINLKTIGDGSNHSSYHSVPNADYQW